MSLKRNISKQSVLRVGFVPLTDCSPLVMAKELGLFQKFGLRVSLQREIGWASVRDKIVYGELDAAHALVAMPFAASLGLGSVRCSCVTGLVLSAHGNAITFSRQLVQQGIKDGFALREEVQRKRRERTFTFGVVAPFSSHRHLLRKWLHKHGIDPDRDVRLIVVPPPQMVANLKSGNLDGFCVGEPWNSVAVATRVGECIATSSEVELHHPEKVLMARREFAEKRVEEHVALIAALLKACQWCAIPENFDQLATTLARAEYLGVPKAMLRPGIERMCVFAGGDTNEPSWDKGRWAIDLITESRLNPHEIDLRSTAVESVFRADLFERAARLSSSDMIPNKGETNYENETNKEPIFV